MNQSSSIRSEIRQHAQFLAEASGCLLSQAIREVELLAGKITGWSRTLLTINSDKKFSSKQAKQISEYVVRRVKGEPLAYIIGNCPFLNWEFEVDSRVLIPRPETENLVLEAVKGLSSRYPGDGSMHCLDVGTGSGCIAASIAMLNANVLLEAWDVSVDALVVAAKNLEKFGLGERVKLNLCDALDEKSWIHPVKFDLVVSNPPYILPGDESLDRNVRDFEPSLALYGGHDGLSFYNCLARYVPAVIKDNGQMLLEIGFDQGERVSSILIEHGWEKPDIIKDLQGHDRIVRTKLGKS